jgi:hypothetical protein
MVVVSSSFGPVSGVSATNSTGASKSVLLPTDCYVLTTLYHFHPHLTPNSFVVNDKLKGVQVETKGIPESAVNCG